MDEIRFAVYVEKIQKIDGQNNEQITNPKSFRTNVKLNSDFS